ncbi:MAG: hypothetical protein OEL75_03770, partial [Kiritimatiellaceae bacterium]|nr:hypothetical protein [Kiritimatiellaceae bacterium]
MKVVVKIKNVIQRGEKFHFRMAVPKDCREKIGQREISQSLNTNSPLEAEAKADKLTKKWTTKFQQIRSGEQSIKKVVKKMSARKQAESQSIDLDSFREALEERSQAYLPQLFADNPDEGLKIYSQHLRDCISLVRSPPLTLVELGLPELGLDRDWDSATNFREKRARRKIIIDVLQSMRLLIDEELGLPYSVEYDKQLLDELPVHSDEITKKEKVSVKQSAQPETQEEHDLIKVMEEVLSIKSRAPMGTGKIRADVLLLKEWVGKDDIREYTRADL